MKVDLVTVYSFNRKWRSHLGHSFVVVGQRQPGKLAHISTQTLHPVFLLIAGLRKSGDVYPQKFVSPDLSGNTSKRFTMFGHL